MRCSKIFNAAALALASHVCFAQELAFNFTTDARGSATAASATASPAAVVTPIAKDSTAATPWQWKFERWVDVKELSFSSRYRSEKATDGFAYISNAQERSVVDGRLKLDAKALYTLNFRVSSGQSFNWAYSDFINPDFNSRDATPACLGALPPDLLQKLFTLLSTGYPIPDVPSHGWGMSPRLLYISATPVNWLTAEYGSLAIERGKGSEITTYDDDGYLTGERLRVHDPKHLYFDEIAVTYAFEGDIFQPNFINRTQHLEKSNYHQFLFAKDFTKRLGASTDYTFDKKTHTLREAAYVKLPETKVLDALRVEFYQRFNAVSVGPVPFSGGSGYGLTAERTLFNRVKLDGGYEQVDPHYGATVDDAVAATFGFSMNGDSYSTGKHVFAHTNIKLTPYMALSGFYIHQTQPPPTGEFGFAKEGFNGGLNIDVKKMLTKAKVL